MKYLLVIIGIAILIISGIPLTAGTPSPIAVTSAVWYSTNSTLLPAPGYSYVPLVVSFVAESTVYNLNASLNYSGTNNNYFSYSHVLGKNGSGRDYYNFPAVEAGSSYTIFQFTNISPMAQDGLYQMILEYSFSEGNATVNGNATFKIALLGSVSIVPQTAYFGTPGNPIQATSYESGIPVTVYLENYGTAAATNVSVVYSPQGMLSGRVQAYTISAFPAFESIPITFTANIGAAGLTITQQVVISYYGLNHTYDFVLQLSAFPLIVAGGSVFNTGSVIAAQGMKNIPLTFYLVEDSSVPAVNVSVTYTPTDPLSGVTQHAIVSAIPQYEAVPVTFFVNISGPTVQSLQNLTLLYNGSYHSLSFEVIIPGYSNVSMVNYYTNPPYIYEDQQFVVLKVGLVNGGNSYSGPLNISLSSNNFTVTTLPYSFPSLPAGQLLNLSFLISAGSVTGPTNLYLHVNNKNFTLVENILSKGRVKISSPEFSVDSGTNGNLFNFAVKNTGNTTIVDLNLHILTPDVFYIDVPSSNPLGSLTANNVTFAQLVPGQTILVTFMMDVMSSVTQGSYPAQLLLSYRTNNSTTPFLVTHNFNIVVQQTAFQTLSASISLTYVVIVIAVAIIIAFSILIVRRRRKNKK